MNNDYHNKYKAPDRMEQLQKQQEQLEKEQEEKRKTLPPLETWLDSDKTAKELHEMGYSYLEMMKLAYSQ